MTDSKAQADLLAATTAGKFSALGKMAMFPAFTFLCYLALIGCFRSRGGYKPVQLNSKTFQVAEQRTTIAHEVGRG